MAKLPRDTIYHYEYDGKENINITITDLIRCKDCKYYYNTDPESIPTANIICSQMHEDDYCSYAERKEE